MKSNRRTMTWVGVAVAVVLFVAVNVLSQTVLRHARIDLTEDGLFTLSDGTRNILQALDEPLTVRFFISQKLANDYPPIRDYASRVLELLEEYVAAADGMIELSVIDPEPFTDAEDDAVGFGLQGATVNNVGDQLYFGMVVTNTTDDEKVVPFFQQDREAFLEYDLTSLFHDLANPKKSVVGLISSLPITGGAANPAAPGQGMSRPWTVVLQVQQLFELRDLGEITGPIADDIDVLLIVHPKDMTPAALFAIDQYVLGGGKALIFVDPFSEASAMLADPQAGRMQLHNSNLQELFTAWGIELIPGMIVADLEMARRVQIGARGRPVILPYVPWLEAGRANLNADEVTVGGLERINLATAGAFRVLEDARTEMIPLIQSSTQAMVFERYRIQFRRDPQALLDEFEATGESYVMAARLQGDVASAFPDGPPEGFRAGDDAGQWLSESAAPINVIVVGDTDMLADGAWVQLQQFLGQSYAVPMADNGTFVSNALDVLAGSNELIGLRSRGTGVREFEVVEALKLKAEAKYRETEQALQAKLSETENKLAELQTSEASGAPVLSAEQEVAIEAFRRDMVATRKQLRDVRHDLQKDIEGLGTWLKVINIGAVPLVIAVIAVLMAPLRRRRRQRALN